jgi:isopentenyl diphosphate isomerase/L-lactate dehydrogenase-like FMN-dependent dehydrogenase
VSDRERINVAEYADLAEAALEPGPRGYFFGGAGDERTLRRNVEAYGEWELVPRVLVDVSEVDTSVEVLGSRLSMPIAVAPVAFQKMAHDDGEEGMARAAAAAGTAMAVSTISTTAPADVAAVAPGSPRWFQLYCFRDRGVTDALLAEAVESGYSAVMLTVDAPFAGRRERDMLTGFVCSAETPSLQAATGSEVPLTPKQVFDLVDPSLTWDDFETLAAGCELPVLVKGIHCAADAELAIEHGAGGIVVSNHGGRQLDGVAATIDALPDIADAVDGQVPILIDGGVRRGTDAAVALALGANAVMVGRPALWGLAADGERGARHVLALLRAEFELALSLLGVTSPAELTRAHVHRRRF